MDNELEDVKPATTLENEHYPAVKIKEEKVDPEIEQKISAINIKVKEEPDEDKSNRNDGAESDDDATSTSSSNASQAEDDKKSIEPVKSSNEILAELFKVFNAVPPEEILDDKTLLKKSHTRKKHKKGKKKKHKKSKSDDEHTDCDDSLDLVSLETAKGKSSKDGKHKHKKKKKSKDKHKKEKDKESSKSKEKRSKDKSEERDKSGKREKTKLPSSSPPLCIKDDPDMPMSKRHENSRKRHANDSSKDELPRSKKDRKEKSSKNSFYNGFQDDRKKSCDIKIKIELSDSHRSIRHTHKDRDKDEHNSEISLSDEETYLKERERVGSSRFSKRRFEGDKTKSANRSRPRNSFYDVADSHSHNRDRNPFRSRTRRDTRSRSRSRSRSHDLGIDKKRLLEIARKNAISMFKRGNLPGCAQMTEEVKDKVLLKMRYGGRTVQDLTDFCKKISNGENLSDLSSDEDSEVDKSGNTKAFHHPFQLKERDPIVMHIRNAKTIAPKSDNQTKAITMQFPVSSGQHHRQSEVWTPVQAKETVAPLPALPPATQSTNIFKAKNVFEKPMPQEEQQEPAFKPVPTPVPPPPELLAQQHTETAIEPLVIPTSSYASVVPTPEPSATTATAPFVPDVPVPTTAASDCIFPQTDEPPLDVSSIISKRLNAMRRLQENPLDPEALKMMYNSTKDMCSWASSKTIPGQFMGSTGVNVLTTRELNSGPQVWARRDQLTSTQPVTGGRGMHLLQKMGWKPGEGLGREKTGSLQPLLLDVKLDKRGLVSKDDIDGGRRANQKKHKPNNVAQAQQNMEDKHPVCLLNELTSKRKWTPPLYTLVEEVGPAHSKMFLFSVSINGQIFKPEKPCNTKKEAKLTAARYCLKQMGILS